VRQVLTKFRGLAFAGEGFGMPNSRKDSDGNHGYAAPVVWIVLLLCGYWVISEWHSLPALINSAIATIR